MSVVWMKRSIAALFVACSVLLIASHSQATGAATFENQGEAKPQAPAGGPPPQNPAGPPPLAEARFKNIQIFKGMPALRVLRVMAIAFTPALGVDCSHCHTVGEWEKDDKEPKQMARKMWAMQPKINALLKETIGKGTVNCTTCHRGQVKPALNLSK